MCPRVVYSSCIYVLYIYYKCLKIIIINVHLVHDIGKKKKKEYRAALRKISFDDKYFNILIFYIVLYVYSSFRNSNSQSISIIQNIVKLDCHGSFACSKMHGKKIECMPRNTWCNHIGYVIIYKCIYHLFIFKCPSRYPESQTTPWESQQIRWTLTSNKEKKKKYNKIS